jgi:hypothetical protein
MLFRISSRGRKKILRFTFSKSFHSIFKAFSTYNINFDDVSILNLIKMYSTGIVTIR